MAARTVSRAVVEALEAGGIRRAFTVPGESFLGVLDALGSSRIRVTAARHEGGAAFMAEAYGQLTGRPAVCLATRAVGAANLSIGLHTARQDSTPLIAVVGQVPRRFRGREAFQEVDLVATFGALCKAAVELDDPATAGDQVAGMVAVAREGRPGPVLIALPEDLMAESGGGSWPSSAAPARPVPSTEEARDVLRRLATADRPVILAGAGVLRSDGVPALAAFADAADLPVVAAWRRPDVLPNESPRYLGMTGLGAPPSVLDQLLAADQILAMGTRLSQVASYDYRVPGAGTSLIQVDIEPGFAGDRPPPALAVRADARAFLELAAALLRAAPPESDLRPAPERAAERQTNQAHDRAAYLAATQLPSRPSTGRVDPAAVMKALRRFLPPAAIVTTDAGNFAGWAARYLPIRSGGRFLGPTSGAMGYALPAAIGAALAEREDSAGGKVRPIVALAGDGGFAMLMAELETAVREGLRLVALVFDNEMYGTIRMHQELAHGGRAVATDLGPVDFAAVARACGARAWTVEADAAVGDVLENALQVDDTVVVHLRTDPRYLSVDRLLEGRA
jgi:acetolactate synthase-1/2/3 large subunit